MHESTLTNTNTLNYICLLVSYLDTIGLLSYNVSIFAIIIDKLQVKDQKVEELENLVGWPHFQIFTTYTPCPYIYALLYSWQC